MVCTTALLNAGGNHVKLCLTDGLDASFARSGHLQNISGVCLKTHNLVAHDDVPAMEESHTDSVSAAKNLRIAVVAD